MNAPTLTSAREFWHSRSRTSVDADAEFLEAARRGRYGPRVADLAAELCTTADAFPIDDDPAHLADQLVSHANQEE
ncbi:hypothetical protein FB384_004898 [Prauserella sediminis]|uniref:Uncharacterized protein n=1 Tax=Prauserella sediminis TaxID=577680 RepID=A0A839XV64_9PSEU|nr:hypothetical protein [Prauserella sediminis]MBB3665939.1 hypothetical protein [Prauserella sediminis]